MVLSALSIKRPVFATVMMLALVTLGAFAYRHLTIDEYPDVEIPVMSITTVYEGAPPETVEREVSRRIEEAINTIQGVKHIHSTSQEGISSVVVEFTLETKLNDAVQEGRAKINAIRSDLPEAIKDPVIQKLDFSAAPIVSLAVRSDTRSDRDLTTLVEKRIKRRIENISGVGRVDLVGDRKREVNIWLDPHRIEAMGLGINEIIAGIRGENVNSPLGRINRGDVEMPVRISGKPGEVPEYETMVVAWRQGLPVRLRDIARIEDGIEEPRTLALVNGQPAVALNVLKQSGANTVVVADGVKRVADILRKELPPDVTLDVVRDGSVFIRESVEDVETTMVIGGILTVLIVFCFLNSWRSTVITGLTLPISVIASFIVMMALGFTLNVMTLMGLSLAIGLLIDDAIVVRENIVRHLQQGKDHRTASLEGTSEIGLAVMATTFSIVAVFIPVAYMKGIVGRFFYQFGITVTFAVLVSLFVSFTLDPMLSSIWVDPDIESESHAGTRRKNLLYRLLARFNRFFESLTYRYQRVITWALRHRISVVGIGILSFVAALMLAPHLGSSFFTTYDRGEFQIDFTASPDASLQETRGRTLEILDLLKRTPGIALTYATIGAGSTGTVRDGSIFVKLLPKSERRLTQEQIEEEIRRGLFQIAGIIPKIGEVGNFHGASPINLNIRGEDLDTLKTLSEQFKREMAKIPGIVDITSTLDQDKTEIRIRVDRARAMSVGIATDQVRASLGAFLGGTIASTWEDPDGDAYNVRVRLPDEARRDMSQIRKLSLVSMRPDGSRVAIPLSDIVDMRQDISPAKIQRLDLRRRVAVQAKNIGVSLGDAVQQIQRQTASIPLPPGYVLSWSGEAEDMAETFRYIFEALALAVILIYLILAAQFESFIAPLSIMVSLPLSLIGVVGLLYLTHDTMNIMSLIGLIMLMGLVTKNAILLVDYAQNLQQRGYDRFASLVESGKTRLRPILMTTLAMIFGMLPLALALGPGAEMRAPMARGVIGGLITSTLLTLVMVPVVYTLLMDGVDWIRGRKARWALRQEGRVEG